MCNVSLTWVVDDRAAPPLQAEHGFSMWIETAAGRVLFDTGGSGEVLNHNLAALGLDPAVLDAVVLSHGHDDHTGGLAALVSRLRPGTPVYGHTALFRERYSRHSGTLESRGLPVAREMLEKQVVFHLSRAPVQVLPGVWTTGEISLRRHPEGRSRWHVVAEGDGFVPDPYEDDLSLVLEVGPQQLVLVCGCCHAGLLNTLETVRRQGWGEVISIVGGVHLASASADAIASTVDVLGQAYDLQRLWLGHCSGSNILEAAETELALATVAAQTAGHTLSFEEGQVVCG